MSNMVNMKSERPLLIGSAVSTEFQVSEQQAKELEDAGLAVRTAAPAESILIELDETQPALTSETIAAAEPAEPAKAARAKGK
jgi:hypothetical protein